MIWHQVNVAFPEPLYRQFVRLVPAGERTKFLTGLAENGLRHIRLQQALNHTYGAWAKSKHPELKRGARAYVRGLRRGRRLKT